MTPGLPDSAHDAEATQKRRELTVYVPPPLLSSPPPGPWPIPAYRRAPVGPSAGLQASRGTYGADFLGAEELLKQPSRLGGSSW